MRFEGARQKRRSPGLTPLIDVVFLLLIFFMLATRFDLETSLPLRLAVVPDAGEGSAGAVPTLTQEDLAEEDRDALVLRLDASGDTWLAGEVVAGPALTARLIAALSESPARTVRVVSDATVSVQRIVDALRGADTAGARSVLLARSQ